MEIAGLGSNPVVSLSNHGMADGRVAPGKPSFDKLRTGLVQAQDESNRTAVAPGLG
jgi:hypothetical protein